jgi:hypothetical protein
MTREDVTHAGLGADRAHAERIAATTAIGARAEYVDLGRAHGDSLGYRISKAVSQKGERGATSADGQRNDCEREIAARWSGDWPRSARSSEVARRWKRDNALCETAARSEDHPYDRDAVPPARGGRSAA